MDFTFLLVQRLESDDVADLTPGIRSHVRLKNPKKLETNKLKISSLSRFDIRDTKIMKYRLPLMWKRKCFVLSFVVDFLWISSDKHDSRFQELSLTRRQIPDVAIKGRCCLIYSHFNTCNLVRHLSSPAAPLLHPVTSLQHAAAPYTQHQLLHHSYIWSHHINLQLDRDNNICSYFTVQVYTTSTAAPLLHPVTSHQPAAGPYTQHQLLHHSYIRSHHFNLQLDRDNNICSYFTVQVYTTSTAAPLLHPVTSHQPAAAPPGIHNINCCTTPTSGHITSTCSWTKITTSAVTSQSRYTQHQPLHHSYIRSHHINPLLHRDNAVYSYYTVSVIHNINCCTTPTSGHITSTCSCTVITTSAVTSQSRYTQHQLLHHSYIRSHHINLQLDRDNNISVTSQSGIHNINSAPLLHPSGIHNINCCTTPTSGHITSTCSCTVITTSAVTSQSRYTQHQLLHHSYIRSHHFNLQLDQDNNICSYFTVKVYTTSTAAPLLHPVTSHQPAAAPLGYTQHQLLHHSYIRSHHINLQLDQDNNICSYFTVSVIHINYCTTPTSGHITSTCSWTKITTSAVTSQSSLGYTQHQLLHHSYIRSHHFNLQLHRDNNICSYFTVSVIHNINCCTTPTSGHITSTCSWTKITTSAVTSQSRYTQHQLLHHSYIRSHHINPQLHRDNTVYSYYTVSVIHTTATTPTSGHSLQPAAAP
ncbi:hypothetical protein J6590_078918 [Homalodisca vitripennis]|nr:hypothetical protein J6590_091938 [Homalodisca vitripennis]KAG8335005.1 hypothetical protein J6590_078918 [Homalodisca vitripennis]